MPALRGLPATCETMNPDATQSASALDTGQRCLRLLSYNMQVALPTRHYGDYLAGAWRHVLPPAARGARQRLERIAELVVPYDFVALQEADAGSLRTRGVNQLEFLAHRAGFAHWGLSVTRDLHPLARHSLGFLSRLTPRRVQEHRLPARIPGRSALAVELGPEAGGLVLMLTHLSLGENARRRQLEFLSQRVPPDRPFVLIGDLNCGPEDLRRHGALRAAGLHVHTDTPATYPSWRPYRCLDHVLWSRHLRLRKLEALPQTASDHLPLAAELVVPLP
jgi:endonuclease/exonuclease/phosphatase family metal-dependent hydrolase